MNKCTDMAERLRHIAAVYGFPLELVDDIDALLREADRERMVADEYRKVVVTEANLANDRIAELEAALREIDEKCSVSSHPHCFRASQIARAALGKREGE